VTNGRVLRRALHQRQRVLDPGNADTEGHETAGLAKCNPSIINATRSSPDRSRESSSTNAVSVIATNRRETANLLAAKAFSVTCSPTGSSPTGLAAGREPGQHLLHRHLAQVLRRDEQLNTTGPAVHPTRRRPAPAAGSRAPRRPSPVQGHRTRALAALPHRGPASCRVCPSARPAPSRRTPSTRLDLASLHGGPLLLVCLGGPPDTYHTAGLEQGTATSCSTRSGQPPAERFSVIAVLWSPAVSAS